jgi:hypothetical protein
MRAAFGIQATARIRGRFDGTQKFGFCVVDGTHLPYILHIFV